jgi:hypothetical protein
MRDIPLGSKDTHKNTRACKRVSTHLAQETHSNWLSYHNMDNQFAMCSPGTNLLHHCHIRISVE